MKYLFLIIAIISETIATSNMKCSENFTKLIPTLCIIFGYASAFYFLNLTVKELPTSITYALWCAGGIVLISVIDFYKYDTRFDVPAIIGISFICIGVFVLQWFSKTT